MLIPTNSQKFSLFHDADESRFKSWHSPYATLLKFHSPTLDFGCGLGAFLEALRAVGAEGHGIDLDPDMVRAVCEKGFTACAGSIPELQSLSDVYGSIHCSHVVEHMWGDEVVAFIEACYSKLRPDGLLVIRTPNWANSNVRHGGFWDDHTHKRPYPIAVLNRLLADTGFSPVISGYEPFGWEDSYVIVQKGKVSGCEMKLEWCLPDDRPKPKFIARVFRRFLA